MRLSRCFALLLLATSARAETHSWSVDLPTLPTDWNASAVVPRWDPANGTLEQVTVSITATVAGSAGVENPSNTPVASTVSVACIVALTLPDHSVISPLSPSAIFDDVLGAFDGAVDYGGASGASHPGFAATDTASTTSPPPAADLLLFTGPAGNPGTIALPVVAIGTWSTTAGVLSQVSLTASARVTVTYRFTPPAIAAFCFGDGTGAACPCGNSGGVGRGCASSLDASGALLSWTGAASVSKDTLVLRGAGMGGAPVLWFQSTVVANGGLGTPFGDGLRCTSGSSARLGVAQSSGGVAQFPSGSQPSISAQGAIPGAGGVTRHYQALYRNVAPYCTPATFNLTNAIAVPWYP